METKRSRHFGCKQGDRAENRTIAGDKQRFRLYPNAAKAVDELLDDAFSTF
jgi:hypothetical protein